MKRASLWIVTAVLLLAPATPAAAFCLDFNGFCDGLELFSSGGVITGEWVSYDCDGSRDTMTGALNGGAAQIVCGADGCDSCVVTGPGVNWGFLAVSLDGTLEMFRDEASCGDFQLWLRLEYTGRPGVCDFVDSPDYLGSSRTKGWEK